MQYQATIHANGCATIEGLSWARDLDVRELYRSFVTIRNGDGLAVFKVLGRDDKKAMLVRVLDIAREL